MIGEQIRKILIQKRTVTQSPSGAPVESWDVVKRLYAMRFQAKGSESVQGGQKVAHREDRFVIRQLEVPEINERDYRVIEGQRIYDIRSINQIGRKEWDLACEVRDNEFYEG